MKLNRFLSIAAAALAVFASCGEKDNPIQGEASLTIKSETAVTVGTETGSVDIEFVATRDWTAKSDAAWASVDPARGSASSDAQKVTVTVLPNDGYARDAKITLSIGTLKKTVSIHQEGSGAAPDGTKDNPFDVASAIAKCKEIGQTASAEQYYIKGKIVSFKEAFSAQFGNMTFYISDDGTAALDQFLVFRVLSYNGEKFVSGDQLKVGDEVVVKAALVNYYGNTPETNQGGHLISVNGGQTVSDYMSISNNYAEVTAAAGSLEITVTANQSWSVVSDSDFAKVSPAEGSGDGKVKLEYTANGKTPRTAKITFTAKDGKKATFTLRQLEEGAVAAQEITWKAEEWEGINGPEVVLKKNGYTITVKKNDGTTNPLPKDGEFRAYAKHTVTIESEKEMTSIVFTLGQTGQYSAITADCGEVGAQAKGDTRLSWTGSSKKVVLTVGVENTYGSNSEKKNGQFRFTSIEIK